MLKLFFVLLLLGVAYAVVRNRPAALIELAKDLSDRGIETVLRATSQFESEMTPASRAEQDAWRQQRDRDVRIRGGNGMTS